MSPPIYTPGGSEVSEIVLPDGSTASQVIGPDGNVVFEAGPDIPDSAIYRWPYDEGGGSTVSDTVGSADGTVNGASWTSGTYIGDYALTGDGADDYVDLTSLGDFGGSVLPSGAGIYLTIEGTGTGRPAGVTNPNNTTAVFAATDGSLTASSGQLEWLIRGEVSDGGDYSSVHSTTDVTDGSKYRVCLAVGDVSGGTITASDMSIYVNGSDETTVGRDANTDPTADFEDSFLTHAYNNGGAVNHAAVTIDGPLIVDQTPTASDVQDDYDRQPWS